MGIYLNQDNESFKKYLNQYYIDKSMLIKYTNKCFGYNDIHVCYTST